MKQQQRNNQIFQGTTSRPPRYRVSGASGRGMPQGNRMSGKRMTPAKAVRTVTRRFIEESEITEVPARLIDRFNSWRLGISVDGETILKGVIIGVLMVLFTLFQTTLFVRFRPFGATPDLILPFVIAVGTLEKEKWGAVTALIAAFFVDAAGGTEITLLPILYVSAAYAAAILTTHTFRDSVSVAAVYTVSTSALRGVITYVIVMITVVGITPGQAILDKVLPEFAANIVFAAIPQLITRLALKPFHKTRAERVGGI